MTTEKRDVTARGFTYDGRAMPNDFERFHEAALDFAYEVVKALGIVALVRRLGMEPKAWVREREGRRD